MPKVSLIIPVYNARDTIAACLDSVLAQTLDSIETVLVDDHGADDSIEVAREHLKGYAGPKRFRFTETPSNAGPGSARNKGIEVATGEYVAFLDSDDTIEPGFCSELYEAAVRYDAEMACCHIFFDDREGRSVIRRNPAVVPGNFEGKAKRDFLLRFTSFFTTFLYSRPMLREHGICFPDTHCAEDSCFLSCALLTAKRMASVDRALYHYNIHPVSVSKKKDPERWKNRIASFKQLLAYARDKGFCDQYGGVIRFIVLKKGYLLAINDFLKNNLTR